MVYETVSTTVSWGRGRVGGGVSRHGFLGRRFPAQGRQILRRGTPGALAWCFGTVRGQFGGEKWSSASPKWRFGFRENVFSQVTQCVLGRLRWLRSPTRQHSFTTK